jgi:5-methylcytosine-specific restriction endonuclease McrA
MANKAYSELLKNPLWQKKRLEIMQRDGFRCCLCMSDSKELTVHHLFYMPNIAPWEYDDEVLVTLCSDCHGFAHSELTKIAHLIAFSVLKRRKSIIDVDIAINKML